MVHFRASQNDSSGSWKPSDPKTEAKPVKNEGLLGRLFSAFTSVREATGIPAFVTENVPEELELIVAPTAFDSPLQEAIAILDELQQRLDSCVGMVRRLRSNPFPPHPIPSHSSS